jgi:putative ABC transport system permease protein
MRPATVEGYQAAAGERRFLSQSWVAPKYFETLGMPLLMGRDFSFEDAGRARVAIVNQTFARYFSGIGNPIGKHITFDGDDRPFEIVGVVGDVRSVRLDQHNDMEFYRPFAQENFPFLSITVQSPLPPDTVTKTVQAALRTIDPNLALILPQPVKEIMRQALGQAKLMMVLLGVFAGVALLLATVGIYGAVAYTVEQRTGEIGVRIALGAQTRDVLSLIVNQGMKPVVIGLAVGLVAAFALGRLLTSQLFEVSAHNPALIGGATVLLAATALLACLLPARRAALVDPVEALRAE